MRMRKYNYTNGEFTIELYDGYFQRHSVLEEKYDSGYKAVIDSKSHMENEGEVQIDLTSELEKIEKSISDKVYEIEIRGGIWYNLPEVTTKVVLKNGIVCSYYTTTRPISHFKKWYVEGGILYPILGDTIFAIGGMIITGRSIGRRMYEEDFAPQKIIAEGNSFVIVTKRTAITAYDDAVVVAIGSTDPTFVELHGNSTCFCVAAQDEHPKSSTPFPISANGFYGDDWKGRFIVMKNVKTIDDLSSALEKDGVITIDPKINEALIINREDGVIQSFGDGESNPFQNSLQPLDAVLQLKGFDMVLASHLESWGAIVEEKYNKENGGMMDEV